MKIDEELVRLVAVWFTSYEIQNSPMHDALNKISISALCDSI